MNGEIIENSLNRLSLLKINKNHIKALSLEVSKILMIHLLII